MACRRSGVRAPFGPLLYKILLNPNFFMKYVWIVFTLYFVVLSIYHLRKSRQIIGPFKNRAEVKTINDKSIGILEFTEDFNEYLARVNKENKTNNIINK